MLSGCSPEFASNVQESAGASAVTGSNFAARETVTNRTLLGIPDWGQKTKFVSASRQNQQAGSLCSPDNKNSPGSKIGRGMCQKRKGFEDVEAWKRGSVEALKR